MSLESREMVRIHTGLGEKVVSFSQEGKGPSRGAPAQPWLQPCHLYLPPNPTAAALLGIALLFSGSQNSSVDGPTGALLGAPGSPPTPG